MLRALRIANIARDKEYDPDNKIGLLFRSNEMAGEVGEACNVVKKLELEKLGLKGKRADLKDPASELADVVICADLIAMTAGIDLEEAVKAKFNVVSSNLGFKTRME